MGDYRGLPFDLDKAVELRFDAEGNTIPFPRRDTRLHEMADRSRPGLKIGPYERAAEAAVLPVMIE